MTANVARAVAVTNPFPGLRPFREDEEYLFFGREGQIDRIVDKLAVNRFLAVVGTSGSGKSSLVNCGLRPALRRGLMPAAGTSWRFVQFRPGTRPVEAMAAALAGDGQMFPDAAASGMSLADLIAATLRMSNLGLADVCEQARLPERTNLLVIVDQFEELFRYRTTMPTGETPAYGASEEATTFVNLLLAAQAQSTFPIYVVLTMRSDFLGDCSQFYGLPEAINEGQYLVPRMTRDERRAAIAGPAEVMGAAISPVLLTRLVNDTGDNPDQLSILQHALNRTWAHWHHQRGADGPLSVESYEAIGAMASALDTHAEKAFAEIESTEQRRICEKVFKALTDRGTDPRGVRRPTPLERLRAIANTSPRDLEAVLDVFRKPSRSFLMPPVPEPLGPDTVIDISHESLMRVWKRLHLWTQEEAESASMYRRIRDTAAMHAAGKAGLWRDPDLQVALDWKEREGPTEQWSDNYGGGLADVLGFVDRSKGAHDREKAEVEFQRRWVRWVVIPSAIVLFALYANTTRGMRAEIEALSSFFTSSIEPRRLRLALGFLIESTLPAIPFILAGTALITWGRQAYWRFAFPTVYAGVSNAVVQRAPPPLPPATELPATEALNTTYASLKSRFVASVIDGAIVAAIMFATLMPFITVDLLRWPVADILGDDITGVASDAAVGWWFAASFASYLAYHVVTSCSLQQATFGMRAVRIIVTDLHGARLSPQRALGRQLAKILSYYTLVVGFLMQLFTKRRQMLHDLISKTVVLNAPDKPSSPPVRPR